MAYQGWLLKIGNFTVDASKYIKANSYSPYINIQDIDSYRDANGVLRRTVLEHVPLKIEFETPAMMNDTEMEEFFTNLKNNYTIASQRKAMVSAYIPELCEYITQECYIADPKPSIYGSYNGQLHYNSMRVAIIGY